MMQYELKRGSWLGNVLNGLRSLLTGMKITLRYFVRPSTVVTQQYPENRETLVLPARGRGQLVMVYDEQGYHECNGCGMCEQHCPNGSLLVTTSRNAAGRKQLEKYVWRMDSCIYCNLCTMVCPSQAIAFKPSFENAVYERGLLVFVLNRYAGPTGTAIKKLEDPEEGRRQMVPVAPYEGELPVNGKSLPGLHGLPPPASPAPQTEPPAKGSSA
jgi:NADH-quinone oxidoreductase subunit I